MSKEAVFTMKLEPALRDEFMSAAQATHRPASQILRELMREYVQRQRQASDYDNFLSLKVEQARMSLRAGTAVAHDEVETLFAERRAKVGKLA